jgi:hypothetical protein
MHWFVKISKLDFLCVYNNLERIFISNSIECHKSCNSICTGPTNADCDSCNEKGWKFNEQNKTCDGWKHLYKVLAWS